MSNRVATLVAATFAVLAGVAADGVEWRLENDAAAVYFKAKAEGLDPVALFLNPDGQGTRVFRLVFDHEGAVREAVAQDNNLGADSFDVSEKWRSGASCSTERTAKGWALTAEIPVSAFARADFAEKWGVRVARTDALGSPRFYEKRAFPGIANRTDDAASEPVEIKLTAPCYLDCVFETMHLDCIEGVVLLRKGVGSPLEVSLEGKDFRKSVKFDLAAATNRFSFPFAGAAKGEYFIRAGGVSKRIRNLPRQEGEIWIDADGVIRVEGEKTLPFGWYSEVYRHMYPGLNLAQEYNETLRRPEQLDERVARARRHGCMLVFSPLQNFSAVPREKLFGKAAAQGEFDGDGLGEERRRTLAAFAERAKALPGFFAYYMQDEPEGRQLNPAFFNAAKKIVNEVDPYHPTMMVNCSTRGIRDFKNAGDILCPDKYPVYMKGGGTVGARIGTYEWAHEASRNGRSAMFTPQVFDWPYFHERGASGRITRGPTYAEIREQCLMALAGDARGFLLYSRFSMTPPSEHLRMGPELVLRELLESKDLYLSPSREVEAILPSGVKGFVAALKRTGNESLLIAVNVGGRAVRAEFRSPELPGAFYVGGETSPAAVAGGRFAADFAPYEAKVFHSRPRAFSFKAACDAVDAAEAARCKPGNLAVAGKFLTWAEMLRVASGKQDAGFPKVETSSARVLGGRKGLPWGYFLQDGFADEFPYLPYHGWAPDANDKSPSVKVLFGEKKRFGKVVVTCCCDAKGAFPVASGSVEVDGRKVAEFVRGAGGRVAVEFSPVSSDAVTVRLSGGRDGEEAWLTEVEAY
ncbi:MAG: hypothetical protein IJG84_03750 [Kiritimatiellae bacterium]|nr:hypothetical protein [Kiritimatiellia bacterium]